MKTKILLIVISSLMSLNVCLASDKPQHLVSVGTAGLGFLGSSETADGTTLSESSVQLNYAYLLENRLMFGIGLGSASSDGEIKYLDEDDDTVTLETNATRTKFDISVGYNFSDDFLNSWWTQLAYVATGYSSETTVSVLDQSSTTESKNDSTGFSLSFGKRYNFSTPGLKNISYSPSVSWTNKTLAGDFVDTFGVDSSSLVTINFLKFDILF